MKKHQFRIYRYRGAHTEFAMHSAHLYESREAALYHAHQACKRRGLDPFACNILTAQGPERT